MKSFQALGQFDPRLAFAIAHLRTNIAEPERNGFCFLKQNSVNRFSKLGRKVAGIIQSASDQEERRNRLSTLHLAGVWPSVSGRSIEKPRCTGEDSRVFRPRV